MTNTPVDTSAKKKVVDNFTRDATVPACIFDLIDNSIDAARTELCEAEPGEIDKYGQPPSYGDYKVDVDITESGVSIADNCSGIPSEIISKDIMRLGGSTTTKYGIGLYGVGLKRALLKLGGDVHITSSTIDQRTDLEFNVQEYIKDAENWDLMSSTGKPDTNPGTIIMVSNPPTQIRNVISNTQEVSNIIKEAGLLYHKFIEKGLSLTINNNKLSGEYIKIREDGPFNIMKKTFFYDNIRIEIIAGQHNKHRFSSEPDYKPNNNDTLTNEYGWTIICNDRPITLRNRESLTGWDRFHSEFYGFVGYVRFYSEDGDLLPWNTPKTGIELTNPAYKFALDEMKAFALQWRKNSRIAKMTKKNKQELLPLGSENSQPVDPTANDTKDKEKPPSKPKKVTLRSVLPDNIDVTRCSDKLKDVIEEAQKVNIRQNRYTSAALLRMLFEISSSDFLIRNNKYKELKKYIQTKRKTKRKNEGLPASNIRLNDINPELKDICSYLKDNTDMWTGDIKGSLVKSLNDFFKRKDILNSAIHDAVRRTGKDRIVGIRDELLPLLIHFINYEIDE